MSKEQLISAIRANNPTANDAFLLDFDVEALAHYLAHLEYRHRPRSSEHAWIRQGETGAIVTNREL